MPDKSFLAWPFFEERHRELAAAIETWCRSHLPVDHSNVDGACRIYEGASEIQKVIIARQMLSGG